MNGIAYSGIDWIDLHSISVGPNYGIRFMAVRFDEVNGIYTIHRRAWSCTSRPWNHGVKDGKGGIGQVLRLIDHTYSRIL